MNDTIDYLNAMSESIKQDMENNDSPRKRRKAAAKAIRDEQKARALQKLAMRKFIEKQAEIKEFAEETKID